MTTLAQDDFTGLGTGDIFGRTPTVSTIGAVWRRRSGTGFDGDGAGRATPGNDGSAATLDTGNSNIDITVDVTFVGTVGRFTVGAREQSAFGATSDAGYAVWNTDASNIRLSWFNSAAVRTDYSAVTAGLTFTTGVTYTLRLVVDGTSVKFYVNGTERISQTDANVATRPHATIGGLPIGGTYGDTRYDNVLVTDIAGDTTDPTLTGVITEVSKTASSISISWPAGADNVAVTSYEVSSNGGSSYTDVGLVLTHTFTGLTASTAYALRVRAKDGASLVSTPPLSTSITTLAADTTDPLLAGSITATAITSGTFSTTCPVGTDNVAVVAYDVRENGGAWIDNGASRTYNHTGKTQLTAYTIEWSCRDAAGRRSNILSLVVTTFRNGATGQFIIDNTGPISGGIAGAHHNKVVLPGDADKWFASRETTPPASGTLTFYPDGTYTFIGPDGTVTYRQLEVDGVDFGTPFPIFLYTQRVSVTQECAWSVRALASASNALAWSVRNLASATQLSAWSVRNVIGATQSAAWSVRNLISDTASLAWSVGAAVPVVSATQGVAWAVRGYVTATQTVAWSVEGIVYTSAPTGSGFNPLRQNKIRPPRFP